MKLGYRPKEAAEVVGSETLLDEMVSAGWLRPVLQRHKLTLFDYSDLAKCWARICQGDKPPPLKRRGDGLSPSTSGANPGFAQLPANQRHDLRPTCKS